MKPRRPWFWWIRKIKCLLFEHRIAEIFIVFKNDPAAAIPAPRLVRCTRCGQLGRAAYESQGDIVVCTVEMIKKGKRDG